LPGLCFFSDVGARRLIASAGRDNTADMERAPRSQIPHEPSPGLSPAAVAALFGAVLVVVAWPAQPSAVGLAWVVGFAVVVSGAFHAAYRAGALLTALFVALYALVYAIGLGDAVIHGVRRSGLLAPAASTREAVALVALFIASTTLVALVTRRRGAAAGRASVTPSVLVGFVVIVAAATVAAFGTGAWTNWGGGGGAPDQAAGGLRLELLYPALLFATVGLVALAPAARDRRLRLLRIGVGLGLALLVFALQSRRMMFACAALTALAALRFPSASLHHLMKRHRGFPLRVAAVGVPLVVALVVALIASSGWRAAASHGQVELAAGLRSALSAATTPESFDTGTVEERLTYLWMDGIAIELADTLGVELDVTAALETSLLLAVPSALYGGKSRLRRVTCEEPMAGAGVDNDLPCTATAEAYLGLGAAGVALIALLWGLYIALAERLLAHQGALARVAGLVLFAPVTTIETGLFPMSQGVRGALLVVLGTLALSILAAAALRGLGRGSLPIATPELPGATSEQGPR